MGNKFTFQGHTFDDEKQLIAAKKEAEAIEYLRSKTDFGNMNNLRKLYDRILDRDMMETVVGIEFLKEIRATLVGSGMFTDEQLRPIPLLPEVKKLKKRKDRGRDCRCRPPDRRWPEPDRQSSARAEPPFWPCRTACATHFWPEGWRRCRR